MQTVIVRLTRKIYQETFVEIEVPDPPVKEEKTFDDVLLHTNFMESIAKTAGDKAIDVGIWDVIKTDFPRISQLWDKSHHQDESCVCGHPYSRHFDSYDDMRSVCCKYCVCKLFRPLEH